MEARSKRINAAIPRSGSKEDPLRVIREFMKNKLNMDSNVVGIVEADIGGAEAVAASFNLAATSLRRRLLFRPALITKRARFCQK